MSQHVAGERPNLSTAGPPKLRHPSRLLDLAGRPRGQTAPRANGRCWRFAPAPLTAVGVSMEALQQWHQLGLRQLRRPTPEQLPSAGDREGPNVALGDPNRSPEPDGVRAPSRSPGSSGGRGWIRTNDFCRVKRVRPPHTAFHRHAPHHIVPARQYWRVEATSWCAWRREGSVLTDC